MTNHNAVLVAAYRSKAAEALDLARRARQEGRETAMRGYLDEAIHWKAMADAVIERARSAALEVTHA